MPLSSVLSSLSTEQKVIRKMEKLRPSRGTQMDSSHTESGPVSPACSLLGPKDSLSPVKT